VFEHTLFLASSLPLEHSRALCGGAGKRPREREGPPEAAASLLRNTPRSLRIGARRATWRPQTTRDRWHGYPRSLNARLATGVSRFFFLSDHAGPSGLLHVSVTDRALPCRWLLPGLTWRGKPLWLWAHMGLQLLGYALFVAGFIQALVVFPRPGKGSLKASHANMG
jgi:hypothetical protein